MFELWLVGLDGSIFSVCGNSFPWLRIDDRGAQSDTLTVWTVLFRAGPWPSARVRVLLSRPEPLGSYTRHTTHTPALSDSGLVLLFGFFSTCAHLHTHSHPPTPPWTSVQDLTDGSRALCAGSPSWHHPPPPAAPGIVYPLPGARAAGHPTRVPGARQKISIPSSTRFPRVVTLINWASFVLWKTDLNGSGCANLEIGLFSWIKEEYLDFQETVWEEVWYDK